ncbi:hypothetical protein DYB25_007218 [Aphanomyces astaci]|uniref:Peptidase S9 prolyl oligopeptidase catalytic domain-containing protein n=1 Tax=Aphanomyces astaci TaxID=112090 RepID=A0A396ZUC5_APHAT|nr:hypothetical protein DYB25_007218 [Aphanomyces astaci]RHY51892.1 hypothetical protein DYB38_005550 [Aphanomyces astaci]RHY63344.1 hypothetical protein DYB30_004088 [Aphanomyces astaci]RHY72865.1 hypothetical protein DYB34_011675 [Aphanomyces astaci]RHZ41386.1 hypothetical protein DYB31_003367 [Aphanomyces astaci]
MTTPVPTTIAYEDVARLPTPGSNAPTNIQFSPNGRLIAFLQSSSNELSQQLYGMDVESKQVSLVARAPGSGNTENNLSLEEKLRRERQRQMGVGITSYLWCPAPHSTRILYPLQGNLYLQEYPGADLVLLFDKASTGAKGGAIDPQYSPDGRQIAFVQENEIYVIAADPVGGGGTQPATQITFGAREVGKSHGLACFVTQEELSRFRGFWWSPDSSRIAFEEIDDTHIPEFRIMHSGSAELGDNAQEDHRYPFAGQANPRRRLAVQSVNVSTRQLPVYVPFPDADFYISRVHWFVDGSLGIETLNRLQTEAALLRWTPTTQALVELIHETSAVWQNAHYLYRNLESRPDGSFTFIWASERTGFMHLYLYEFAHGAATLVRPLTHGDGNVESIDGIDLEHDVLYFSGNLTSPIERHLFQTSLSVPNAPITQVTTIPGVHNVVLDGSASVFVDVYHNLTTPPTAVLSKLASPAVTIHTLHATSDPRLTQLQDRIEAPSTFTFSSRDGTATLYGALYKPDAAKFGPGPYPTMVNVYGGPHVMRVQNAWNVTVDMRAQLLRNLGYAVLKVDNRGTYRRGLAFEGAIKHAMGTIEISDQEDGVHKLIQDGVTIAGRVGIIGWSYGGYMSAISLVKAPATFKLGIAGAPVTSWDGYDTCYTERYMSTPQLNPEGYARGNVMNFVQHLQPHQKLLLIHGLIDENVHFRHTARLINALIAARKHYDLLLFPKERHSPRHLEDRIYMEQRIAQYIVANL